MGTKGDSDTKAPRFDVNGPPRAPLTPTYSKDPPINEGYLFGVYGDVRAFAVDGVVRGSHRFTVTSPQMDGTYHANVRIPGSSPLPVTAITRRGPLHTVEAVYGVASRVGVDDIDDAFRVTSRAVGFGAALLGPAWKDIAPVRRLMESIVIVADDNADDPGVSRLIVTATVNNAEHIGAVIVAVRALVAEADGIVARGDVFDSARLVTDAADHAPHADRVSSMTEGINAACAWLGAVAEHIDGAVVARLRLPAASHELAGTVRVAFVADDSGSVDVAFDAALPPTTTAMVTLKPQHEGVLATLARLGEVRVGDDAIDDAFVIRGDAGASTDIVAIRYELLDLRAHIAQAEILPASLTITLLRQPAAAAAVSAQVALVVEAWRELVFARVQRATASR